jgi:hypothetical protein
MKATTGTTVRLVVGCVLALELWTNAQAQLQFTRTLATDERAIQLYWQSVSNTAYRIEFLPDLKGSNNAWSVLYDDYPSHGTNTFWLDTGDYSRTPEVLHPKGTTNRFYRLAKISTNSLPTPVVTILSPSPSNSVSDEITVSVSVASTNSLYSLRLFLDGEDLGPSEEDGGTNWIINTTEWPNGPHVLFAAAKVVDWLPNAPGAITPKHAWGVSAYVPITFNNFISRISFSEPFFEPDLGQTQRVTAVFGSYANWTLQIVDEYETPVRTVTGSGSSMAYDWDGTGDGDVPIPNGVYYYIISTEEAQQLNAMTSVETTSEKTSTLNKIDAGDGYEWVEIPLPPLPYPLRTPDDPQSVWVKRPKAIKKEAFNPNEYLNGYQSLSGPVINAASGGTNTAPKAPKRPPTNPVKGVLGTFGVVVGATSIPDSEKLATGFAKRVKKADYKMAFNRDANSVRTIELRRSDLGIGGSNIFSQVNLGLILAHGDYGTTLDFAPSTGGGSFQTYMGFEGTNNAADPTIRLSDYYFTGEMRWMFLLSCEALRDANYFSMLNKQCLPISDTMHLICGTSTVMYFSEDFGSELGNRLRKKETVKEAWYNTGQEIYSRTKAGAITNTVIFRVSGWTSCFVDRITVWNDPDPGIDTIDEETRQVYP